MAAIDTRHSPISVRFRGRGFLRRPPHESSLLSVVGAGGVLAGSCLTGRLTNEQAHTRPDSPDQLDEPSRERPAQRYRPLPDDTCWTGFERS